MARSDNRAVRLNAYIARAGVASRRKADELIKAGRVQVNGEPGRLVQEDVGEALLGEAPPVELDDISG